MRYFAIISSGSILIVVAYYAVAFALHEAPGFRIGILLHIVAFPSSLVGINDALKVRRGRMATAVLALLHCLALIVSAIGLILIFQILAMVWT